MSHTSLSSNRMDHHDGQEEQSIRPPVHGHLVAFDGTCYGDAEGLAVLRCAVSPGI